MSTGRKIKMGPARFTAPSNGCWRSSLIEESEARPDPEMDDERRA